MTIFDGNLWLSLSAERVGAAPRGGNDGYPPYNIELLPESDHNPEILRITLAVAGFSRNELDVSIENGALLVSGTKRDDGPKDYLHRGIAARHFTRSFPLAQGVEVRKAELHDGLLAIELERPHREKRVLKVGIAPAG